MGIESTGPQAARPAFASRQEAETGRPVRWGEGLCRKLLLQTAPPVLSSFCYFSHFPMQDFPVGDRLFSPKVGLNILLTRQNLDKSGSCVYTKCSFPTGNKSYSLFSAPLGEPPGRESFSGGMLVSAQTLRKKLYEFWRRSGVNLFMAAIVLCTALVLTNRAAGIYIVSGVDDAAIVLDGNGKAPELESRLLYTSNGSRGYDVCLRLGQTVTVHHDGDTFTTKSRQESILKTLRRLDIVPGPLEMVGIDFTDSGVEITVSSDLAYYEHVVEEVAFETVRVANPQMEQGTEKVVQEGSDGIRSSIYEVVWSNGQEIARFQPGRQRRPDPGLRRKAELFQRQEHDCHRLHRRIRRRGLLHRHRHHRPGGHRGCGQKSDSPGDPDVYRHQRRHRLRHRRGRGHRRPGQQGGSVLQHL